MRFENQNSDNSDNILSTVKENVRVVIPGEKSSYDACLLFRINSSKIHYIDNIWLRIELPESLFDLTDKQKYSLLNTIITMRHGLYHQLSSNNMMSCIFNQICSGKNIKQNNNIIEIPLFNFDTMTANKRDSTQIGKQTHTYRGFPMILTDSTVDIYIHMPGQCIEDLKYSLICDGCGYGAVPFLGSMYNGCAFLHMQNTIITEKTKIKHYLRLCGINKIVKAIFIYFSPLTYQINDQIPMIEKVKLSVEDTDLIYFEPDDLLDIDIFGIKIYVLPLSKEFSDWDHINETFCSNGNTLKQLSPSGINLSNIDCLHLHINFYNELPDNYITHICVVNIGIIEFFAGRCQSNSFQSML
jgi:hypothetical protein